MRASVFTVIALALVSACATEASSVPEPNHPFFRTPAGDLSLGMQSFFVPAQSRQVGVRVFYPAAARGGVQAPYADAALVIAMQQADYYDVPDDVLAAWGDLTLPARRAAPVSRASRWPLVVFAGGFGVSAVNYTVFAQDLASRGFVVAVIDSPGLGFMLAPDGSISAAGQPDETQAAANTLQVAANARAVTDALIARRDLNIDPARLAMMGHSLGGGAALEACRLDERLRGCINLDGHPFGPVDQLGFGAPTLVILNQPTPRGTPLGPPGLERAAMWRAIAERGSECARVVTISEISHLSFADFYAVTPARISSGLGSLSGDELYDTVGDTSYAFLTDAFAGGTSDAVDREVAQRDYARIESYACSEDLP